MPSKLHGSDKLINYWVVPTIFIEKLSQKSISIDKIPQAKNNWVSMEKCKDLDIVMSVFILTGIHAFISQ